MSSTVDVIERFIAQVGTEKPRFLSPASSRAKIGGMGRDKIDTVFSYGSHFPMARLIGTRKEGFFLVNSDRYSHNTSAHQSVVRSQIMKSGVKSILLPFSALEAAEIDMESIKPLQVESDRMEMEFHYLSDEELEEARTEVTELSYQLQPGADYPLDSEGEWLFEAVEKSWTDTAGEAHVYNEHTQTTPYEVPVRKLDDHLLFPREGRWAYKTWRHWMGGSLFEASYRAERSYTTHPDMADYLLRRASIDDPKTEMTWGDRYDARNKLAEELTIVPDRFETAKFLSSFDAQERNPLYFLCQLPPTKATTIEEAYEALKPQEVKAAEELDLEVVRQGDIFAVPVAGLDARAVKGRSKRVSLLGTNHTATESFVTTHSLPLEGSGWGRFAPAGTYARGTLYHDPDRTDWRGRVQRDHVRRKLGDGKTWHYIIKNTVPYAVEPQAEQHIRARSFDRNSRGQVAVRGWTMGGRVD